MNKLINDPDRFVDDVLDGVFAAYPEHYRTAGVPRTVVRRLAPMRGKVGIATGGGSGHLPVFMGYVGEGLCDGAAVGDVFASPSSEQMLAVTRAVDGGRGVLYLYGNYGGDVMNFDLAAELAMAEGIEVATVLAADDVASAPSGQREHRRGIAGLFFLFKVAGARSDEGAALATVKSVVEKAARHLGTMAVALSPCVLPAVGRAHFAIAPGEMEIGMGIHGEPGVGRGPLEPADRVAEHMVEAILEDDPYLPGETAAMLINGLGATPMEELFILCRRVHQLLSERHVTVHRTWVGEYATSLEMAGASVSLLKLDGELARLIGRPVNSPLVCHR